MESFKILEYLLNYVKKTRLKACINDNCRFMSDETLNCTFQEIEINKDGKCSQFEQKYVEIKDYINANT